MAGALSQGCHQRNPFQFLRFYTATDILLQGNGIAVDTEVMPHTAVRHKPYTCFRRLIVPRNYQSYSEK